LEPLERIQSKLEATLSERRKKRTEEIAALEQQIGRLQAECAEATKNLDSADRSVQAAQAEVEAAESGRLITKFIEERVAGGDYRKHPGIVSLIRDDFATLSRMITERNRSELQARAGAAPAVKPPKDLGVNRIVLYIDDLDRCPAYRVVEVL